MSDATQQAAVLAALADVLLPGDDTFPSGASAGTHLWVADKLREKYDPSTLDEVMEALATDVGDFSALTAEQQVDAVRVFEQNNPELFGFIRNVAYLGYYQTPSVVQAVQSLGRAYRHAPQPEGYDLADFDPATLPDEPRGSYKKTEAVTRVDTDSIDMDGLEQAWA